MRSQRGARGRLLHLLVAALRNFYEVMRRGVFDDRDGEAHPLYPYENPMYSRTLLAWRTEHHKWIRNAGAPEHAGIRSETRASSRRLPVGYFQVRRQPLEPPVARDAEATRFVILAGIRYVIDHAAARESVILRILLESGGRVSEVLGLTAGGLRSAQNPKIGIDVAALVRDKGSHLTSKPIWFSQQTRDHLQRYIAMIDRRWAATDRLVWTSSRMTIRFFFLTESGSSATRVFGSCSAACSARPRTTFGGAQMQWT
jgi:hypothetical protein